MSELYGGKLIEALIGIVFFLIPIVSYTMVFHQWQFIGFMIGYVCAFIECGVIIYDKTI